MAVKELSNRSAELAIQTIEETIRKKESELSDLRRALSELRAQGQGDRGAGSGKRMAKGTAERYVFATLSEGGKYTIGELRKKIEEEKHVPLRDASARRALDKLIKEKKVARNVDTNEYSIIY